jgi:hypothetical protein
VICFLSSGSRARVSNVLEGAVAVVGEEPSLARDPFERLGSLGDVVEIRQEQWLAVALGELESEASLLFQRVLDCVDLVGPGEGVASEGVVDGVIGGDGEGNAVGGLGAREGEAATFGGGRPPPLSNFFIFIFFLKKKV